MFKNILVPTDGSDAVRFDGCASRQFRQRGRRPHHFFYAQPDFPMPIYGEGALIDPTTPEQFSRAAAQEAERILAKARAAADAAGCFFVVQTPR
jgi:nucleotide-binding universal stress UspA family protein